MSSPDLAFPYVHKTNIFMIPNVFVRKAIILSIENVQYVPLVQYMIERVGDADVDKAFNGMNTSINA